MAHSAAANEYRRMMETSFTGGGGGSWVQEGCRAGGEAGRAEDGAKSSGGEDQTPTIVAEEAWDHFKDCEEKDEAIWHAPATAEEQELSALEKEPTAGMLFVRIVELDLQDAPEHMPIQVEIRVGEEAWTSSAVTKHFPSSGEIDEALVTCGQSATFFLPHGVDSVQIRLSVVGQLKGCSSSYIPSLVPHKSNDCWYSFQGTRNSIRLSLRSRPFPPLGPSHIRRDMFGFVLKGKASPQWGAESIVGGDAWSPGRCDVWYRLSGALAKSKYHLEECTPPVTYQSYTTGSLPEKVRSDIAKDVPRTFPEHVLFAEHPSPLTRSLQRVLEAYARRNPNIGYCQGLNFVCGLLLCVCEEELAFWLLSSLVEDICPNYHSPNMAGLKIDLEVLEELGEPDLANIRAHFEEIGGDLSLVCLPWFLTIFSDSAPARVTFRFWDMVFEGGSPAVMSLALAMLLELEPSILACESISEVMDLMHRCAPHLQPRWDAVIGRARKLCGGDIGYKEIILSRDHHYSLLRNGATGLEADDTMAALSGQNFHPQARLPEEPKPEAAGGDAPRTPAGEDDRAEQRGSLLSMGSSTKGWGERGFWAGVGSAIKVKVGGLSESVRAEDLGEIFGLMGATGKARMSDVDERGTPTRKAIVEFATVEAAQNAVSILDGSVLDGTCISVRIEGDEEGEEGDAFDQEGVFQVDLSGQGQACDSLDDDWDEPRVGEVSEIEEHDGLSSLARDTSVSIDDVPASPGSDPLASDAAVLLARSLLEAAENLASSSNNSSVNEAADGDGGFQHRTAPAKLTPESAHEWHSPPPVTPAFEGPAAAGPAPENLFFSPAPVSPPRARIAHAPAVVSVGRAGAGRGGGEREGGEQGRTRVGGWVVEGDEGLGGMEGGEGGGHRRPGGALDVLEEWHESVVRAVAAWLGGGRWDGGESRRQEDDEDSQGSSCSSEDWRITDWLPPPEDEASPCKDMHRREHSDEAPWCERCAQWMTLDREMDQESEEWRLVIARAASRALAVAVPVAIPGGDLSDDGGRVGALQRLLAEARIVAGRGRRGDMSVGIRAVEAMLACNAEVGVQSQVRDALERTLANILGDSGTGGHRTGPLDSSPMALPPSALESVGGSGANEMHM